MINVHAAAERNINSVVADNRPGPDRGHRPSDEMGFHRGKTC